MPGFDQLSQRWQDWMTASSWQLALFVCIVALVSRLTGRRDGRLRHWLWMLVLLKVLLPPGLTTPVSVGQWAVRPLLDTIGADAAPAATRNPSAKTSEESPTAAERLTGGSQKSPMILSLMSDLFPTAKNLLFVWLVGVFLFWAIVVWRLACLGRILRLAVPIDEGPIRIAVEQIAIQLGVRRVPDVLAVNTLSSPYLFGVFRPFIMLPASLTSDLQDDQWRAVLVHEMVHWQRYDTWIGWLQVSVQSLFWFHPMVWWANAQLRHERECVCDETVLRMGPISPKSYSDAIFRVLTASHGRSPVAASLVGVFERGSNLQNRLEKIMNYEPSQSRFGIWSRVALLAFGIIFVPMSATSPIDRKAQADDAAKPESKPTPKTERPKTAYPTVVETTPKVGATGVDPKLTEVRITFDRDMNKGMSWTGGPPDFPPIDKSRKAKWIDDRTCVLPVTLEAGKYYRTGINSTSHKNFESTDGVPTPSSVIYFTTTGGDEQRVRIPKVASLEPANDATDVDPAIQELNVTFDIAMGTGMSWCRVDDNYPKSPAGKKASWSEDGKTCKLPVSLEPGREYRLSLNELDYINFQSQSGVPLAPVAYKFKTRNK